MPNAQSLRDRLHDEAMQNAVDIVADLGFLKYIKDNAVYSRIYIRQQAADSAEPV